MLRWNRTPRPVPMARAKAKATKISHFIPSLLNYSTINKGRPRPFSRKKRQKVTLNDAFESNWRCKYSYIRSCSGSEGEVVEGWFFIEYVS